MKERHQEVFQGDDLVVRVAVTFRYTEFTDLIGGTAVARMRHVDPETGDVTDVAGSAAISVDGLVVTAGFAEDVLPLGICELQVRATKGSITKTIYRGSFSVVESF